MGFVNIIVTLIVEIMNSLKLDYNHGTSRSTGQLLDNESNQK